MHSTNSTQTRSSTQRRRDAAVVAPIAPVVKAVDLGPGKAGVVVAAGAMLVGGPLALGLGAAWGACRLWKGGRD